MRIVCPSCQAAYVVPEKLLSSGPRRVRCAKCGGDWVPEPEAPAPAPEPEPAEPPPAPPAPEAPAAPVAQATPRADEKLVPQPAQPAGRGLAVAAALAWLASLGLLAVAGWAAVAYRGHVMAAWAPSKRLYALLGLWQ